MIVHPTTIRHADRVKAFGVLPYTWEPKLHDPEHVRVPADWARHNLRSVTVPQLAHLGINHPVMIHHKAERAFLHLWAAWEADGLLGHIHTWNGSWVTRYKRQRGTLEQRRERCAKLGPVSLSNHSWGTAFDVNARMMPLGDALPDDHPYRELEPIAARLGWFWGGWYETRPDPMHWEYVGV